MDTALSAVIARSPPGRALPEPHSGDVPLFRSQEEAKTGMALISIISVTWSRSDRKRLHRQIYAVLNRRSQLRAGTNCLEHSDGLDRVLRPALNLE